MESRIYYSDGSTYTGPPEGAPGWGVIVIAQYGGGWWGHNLAGLFDCLARPGSHVVLHGRSVAKNDWHRLLDLAHRDPDFPQNEDRTLMHGWDHYCWHGG